MALSYNYLLNKKPLLHIIFQILLAYFTQIAVYVHYSKQSAVPIVSVISY